MSNIFTICRYLLCFYDESTIMYTGGNMIYMHNDFIKRGYKDYHVKRLMKEGKLFFIEKGVYSTKKEVNYFEYIVKKHPNAIFNLWTACYCYGLLKENKMPYVIATKQKDRKIKNENIKQVFMSDDLYHLGNNLLKFEGVSIQTFDIERLLIEVVRNKTKIEYAIYEEIIMNYRKIRNVLNKRKLALYFPYFKDKRILRRIAVEVFDTNSIF